LQAQVKLERLMGELEAKILSGDLNSAVEMRYQMQLDDLRQYARATFGEITADYSQFGIDFMEYEANFSAKMIGDGTSAPFLPPSPDQLRSGFFTDILTLQPNQQGLTVEGYLSRFGEQKSNQFIQAIRDGFILGRTGGEIQQTAKGVLDLQRHQLNSMIRTLTNHLANQSRQMTFEQNKDVLEGYEWVATLDSRTSFICMSRDGIIYPISNNPERSPKPPAHFGCRSTTVPVVKREFDLLADEDEQRASFGADGKRPVDGKLNYEQWLRTQPKSFQIQVLGKERQKLFEQQKLPLTRFVDPNGRTLSLDELRQLDVEFNGMTVQQVVQQTIPQPKAEPSLYQYRSAADIKFKSPKEAKARIKEYVEKGNQDPRHYDDTRFSGNPKWGKASRFNDDVSVGLEACIDDLEGLARTFNIPNLRAFRAISRRANADMGDASMGINQKYMGARVPNMGSRPESALMSQPARQKSSWKQGDSQGEKPWSVAYYQDNYFDTFRSTIIHEFGHHVHQTYKFPKSAFAQARGKYQSPTEKKLQSLWGDLLDRRTSVPTAPSKYAETKPVEWFADNFSAYFLNRRDKCDPKFIELIEEMIANAYK